LGKANKNLQELYTAITRILGLDRPPTRAIDIHRKESGVDALYLLMLAALYSGVHALVWFLERLRKKS
jgi:hypothetical protein